MTDKTFKYAGVSTVNGNTKVRFANDLDRVKTLTKNGHDDIDLRELPGELTKPEAVAFLAKAEGFEGDASMAIDEANAKYNPEPKTVTVTKAADKAKVTSKAKKVAAKVKDEAEVEVEDKEAAEA
jgi:hypothetical protein